MTVDLDAVRASIRHRVAGRSLGATAFTDAIAAHVDAIGRGHASVSPAAARLRRRGKA